MKPSQARGDKPLNEQEAAEFLTKLGYQVSAVTLARKRKAGVGPSYTNPFRTVLYLPADLRAWLETKKVEADA